MEAPTLAFKILPVINNKGGVGKTTTTVNVAAGLARLGRRVLLVDLDCQASASLSLGLKRSELNPSSASVLFGEVPLYDAIRTTATAGLDILPASMDLASADIRLAQSSRRASRLAELLRVARADYDHILIDCAPSTSLLNVNAIVAADALLVPLSPSYLSVEGLISFGETIRRIRGAMGAIAPVLGMALTMFDPLDPDARKVADAVRARFGGKVFKTTVRPCPDLEVAPSRSQTIFEFAPDSTGAEDYDRLSQEVLERLSRYAAVCGLPAERLVMTAEHDAKIAAAA